MTCLDMEVDWMPINETEMFVICSALSWEIL